VWRGFLAMSYRAARPSPIGTLDKGDDTQKSKVGFLSTLIVGIAERRHTLPAKNERA